jgi:cytochrome c oxidase assembly protein subunit 15
MPASAILSDSKLLPSSGLRRYAWAVLAYFIAAILWGTLVRATGSGDGCGNHWPLCNGTVIQPSPTMQTMIEFTHRVSAGAIGSIFILVLVIWVWMRTVPGHLARWFAGASAFFTITEGILGALLVKLGLTGTSQSPLRAPFLALHLSNTLLLVAALILTAHMLGRGSGYRWRDVRMVDPLGAFMGMVAVMIVAVTGSMAALGDTLFPATSLENSFDQDLSAKSSWLLRWRWTHPALAVLAAIFVVWLLIRAARRVGPWDNRRLATLVAGLLAAQYVLGVLDVWLLAPLWMQVTHLLGADLMWSALVVLTARLTLVPDPRG